MGPPLLGFFDSDNYLSFIPTLEAPNRVPPGCFSLQRGDGDSFGSLGCRHDLVLIVDIKQSQMLVWDPVTGDQHRLAIPSGIEEKIVINGAVLRVGDTHFQVVLTASNDDKQHREALAYVYSSETRLWGNLISTKLPAEVPVSHHPVHLSDAPTLDACWEFPLLDACWEFCWNLEFDLVKQSLAVIRVLVHMLEEGHFWIMRAKGGGLGLFFQLDTRFQLWKRNTDPDGVASWGVERTIELDKLFSLNSLSPSPIILGFAEDNNVLFMWTDGMLFMVHLESLQFKKIFETNYLPHNHPFEGVYIAGI